MLKRGKLIVIDGFDGVGKSTQFSLLCNRLISEKYDITKVKFPNYNSPSSYFVKEYLKGEFYNTKLYQNDINTAKGISMLYAIDRHHTFYKETSIYTILGKKYFRLIDLLNNGHHIICDRYTTSNMLLQGSKFDRENMDKSIELIKYIYETEYTQMRIPKPDHVIILKIPLELSLELLEKAEKVLDIHETEAYQKKCHSFFKRLMKEETLKYITDDWYTIDCYTETYKKLLPVHVIHNHLYKQVKSVLYET